MFSAVRVVPHGAALPVCVVIVGGAIASVGVFGWRHVVLACNIQQLGTAFLIIAAGSPSDWTSAPFCLGMAPRTYLNHWIEIGMVMGSRTATICPHHSNQVMVVEVEVKGTTGPKPQASSGKKRRTKGSRYSSVQVKPQ